MITIKFFASLKEQLGVEQISHELSQQTTVAQLRDTLLEQGDTWQVLAAGKVLCAVNHTLCDGTATVEDGDEVAFFPPVTGG